MSTSLFTQARVDKIVEALGKAYRHNVAAQLVGIAPQTLSDWLIRGEREEAGPYRDFYERCCSAEAAIEAELTDVMVTEARKDPDFAMRFNTRRWAHGWGRRDNLTIEAPVERDDDGSGLIDTLVERVAKIAAALKVREVADRPTEGETAKSADPAADLPTVH